jgi:hypothetical protein
MGNFILNFTLFQYTGFWRFCPDVYAARLVPQKKGGEMILVLNFIMCYQLVTKPSLWHQHHFFLTVKVCNRFPFVSIPIPQFGKDLHTLTQFASLAG